MITPTSYGCLSSCCFCLETSLGFVSRCSLSSPLPAALGTCGSAGCSIVPELLINRRGQGLGEGCPVAVVTGSIALRL